MAGSRLHGGGRLALTTGGQIVIGAGAPVEDALNLSAAHFQAGFSAYDINGQAGVQVAEGATIDVLMPVYRFGADSLTTPTGAGRTTALERWTPPLYQDDTAAGHLVQRAGADLTLRSQRLSQGGDVVIGEGATVSVDPGATIRLASPTQMTVEGRLNAWGGAILLDAIADVLHAPEAHDRSIWIGDNAVLDVAGRAVTAVDGQGQRQGWVQAGGTIQLGSALDWESGNPVQRRAPDMHVVIRPGALLDASGSSAVLDLPGLEQGSPRAPVTVASDGGSIVMGSANALYIDGTLRAAAGGEGASGGTLALTFQGGTYNRNQATEAVLQPRVLVLTQHKGEDRLGAGAQPGDALEYGTSYLSVEQIDAGGFDHLSLFAPLRTPDDLTLSMGQSLRLWSPFGVFGDAAPERTLHLSAPYLMLGVTGYAASGNTEAATSNVLPLSPERNDVLRIDADHLDVFGRNEFTGFADVVISSQGDIRLLATPTTIGAARTTLFAPDRMTLTAAQIYAASGADGYLGVGDTNGGVQVTSAPDDHLFIRSHGGPVPDMPHSVGGSLHLAGGLIEQGGVLRAPLGFIEIGRPYDNPVVRFLDGSLTSVSGAGLVMPYGGTVDGITYHLNGVTINAPPIGGTSAGGQRQLLISGEQIIVEEGAVLDLSGGGDLRGAGFVSGRGGSVDILATALANANPAFEFSLAGNPVYALVPGYQSGYAPTGGSQGQGAPATGQQVTVPDGVPGLPAGTYTLMPSSYALLPGAFRVEIGQTVLSGLSGVSATGSGSFVAAGYLGTAHTGVRSPVASQLIITPADVVRLHSGYNETSYNEFILADAARRNVARGMLTVDARALRLNFSHGAGLNDEPALTFDGTALFAPAADSAGFGGILGVSVEGAGSSTLQILADGQSPLENLTGAAIEASQLNAFNANRVVLGGYLAGASYYSMVDNVILRSGATLRAPEVALTAGGSGIGVLVEQGATIDTTGLGKPGYASDDGYLFDTLSSALVVSNGWINLLPSTGTVNPTIDLGGCAAGSVCTGETRILTEGTLAVATNGAFTLRDSVSYGARDLVLAVSAVNLGSAEALAEAGAAGQLPPGMALNQQLLAELLDGNTAQSTPALQTLVLNARDAFNIYGSVTLDTFDLEGASRLERLVFGAPAIYGYGSASDVTAIRTGEFIWAGTGAANPNAANRPGDAVPVPPGAAILDRLAGGTLDIHAETIRFGYVPNTQPVRLVPSDRIALGFDTLNLNASKLIAVDTDNGSLHVYRSQTGYTADQGWHYAGGELNINTPLLSGGNGGKLAMHAGGAITVTGSGAGAAAHDTLGAELRFVGQSIHLDTAVVLPSGKLVLDAVEEVVLGAGAKIDLAGREVTLFDVKRYSWGGDLVMASRDGNVRTAAGSVIDISARHNRGGSIDVTALGEGAGQVDLLGTIHGSASGIFDAGGTLVPYDAGQFTVRAQSLTDFAALNARLNDGEVFGARRFQIRQGDLVVGNEVKAREVQIIVDGGDLTVNGKIDASGQQVGAIRLAAKGDLVINGTLDAHATGMRLDSYGKPIAAANRAAVELATREGTLVMGAGAVVDLRTGTASAFADNIARGTLDLIAPRVGTDDVAVDVQGAVEVRGAKTVAVYGLRRYDDAPLASLPDVSGTRPQLITQSYLDGIDLDSQAFMEAALGNASLAARLAGLAQYRLRPAVEITSNAALNPDGHLTVAGDIDLSAYRYGPDANRLDPARRGFGEPGMLVLRAAGDLNIHGSINDGFAPPPDTPDDNGWLLTEGRESYYFNGYTPFGGDIVVPIDGVVLDTGTIFPAGAVLNYDITVAPATLPAGATVPVEVSLTGALSLPAGLVLSADVTTADGTVLPAGTVLADTLVLGAGAKLAAGFLLRDAVGVASFTLPKGTRLATALTTDAPMTLARGALIPSMTKVELVNDEPVNLRPVDGEGRQGRNWALAPMLPEGTTSWDLTLVAGADTGSSDMRARNVLGAGDIVLADTHYGQVGTVTVRYEGGSGGGGGLVLTLDGAMAAFGDARYAGLNAEELEAQLLADYGFGFEDFWGMSLEGYCDFDPGSCAMQEPSDGMEWAFNEEGAIGFFGEASLAGKTQQEIDAWMQDNWGMSWDYAFNGESMASVCKGNDGFCTSTFIDPTLNMEGALGWIGEARFAGLTAEALDAALMDAYSATFQDFFGQTLPDFCNANPTLCQPAGFAPPTEVRDYQFAFGTPAFSVLRTGTGDLSLVAGRDVAMMSLYGVYTAGQQTSIAGIDNHRFNLPRGGEGGSSLGAMQGYPDYDVAQAAWQAWYPDQGGNLLVSAGRNILGDSLGALATSGVPDATRTAQVSSVGVGNWLWRQGTGNSTDIDPVDTSWWINFGSYIQPTGSDKSLRMTGFTGFGALGGGNVRIQAAGDAGIVSGRGEGMRFTTQRAERSQGLVVAVGSTGRVVGEQMTLTGGGDLDIRIGGRLNPNALASQQASSSSLGGTTRDNLDLNGVFTNLRGTLTVTGGGIGGMTTGYGDGAGVRPGNPFAMGSAYTVAGPVLMLGDATAWLETRGDLVLAGAGNPGLVDTRGGPAYTRSGELLEGRGVASFSLWTPATAVNLFSAGGDLAPAAFGEGNVLGSNLFATRVEGNSGWDYHYAPAILRAVAPGGNILINPRTITFGARQNSVLLMAPSPSGALELLAGGSVLAQPESYAISMSGASMEVLSTPFNPAFSLVGWQYADLIYSNQSNDGVNGLIAFGPNTVSTALRSSNPDPVRIYAVDGDITGLRFGAINTLFNGRGPGGGNRTRDSYWYEVASAVQLRAGTDILDVDIKAMNNHATDVTLLQAGRDIVYAEVTVAGPGNLDISAGRQIRQDDVASVQSIGSLVQGDTRPGASIALLAGQAQGVDWSAVRDRYLDTGNLANPELPLAEQPGKAVKVYDKELSAWLKARFGLDSEGADALSYFDALAPEQQRIFLREVYYAELREGGREYNDADGPRFGSYLRGREMIATLLPDTDAAGNEITREGDIVMFGGAGVRSNFGGHIEMMAPGGQILVGVEGVLPPASAGVMTQGEGDIRLFSEQSLLLGLSRIMTTFGGDIFAWSAEGDINAGRGAKTTVLFTPPRRTYDQWGNVRLAPQVPSSGAGIATLNPIPEVPPGDIDLIAPLGTIDAGEAGIRVSGNVNVAALQVLNADNIQVQGEAQGIPVVAAVNTSALNAASSASSAAAQAAEGVTRRQQGRQPSLITVEILGFGDEPIERGAPGASLRSSAVDVLGQGPLSAEQLARLTDAERRRLAEL
ncbi:Filamentous hemagglutinin family outer membrane protein [Alcanivorax sp. S71-1-4]|uniref:filamentous haemagglutinin family protein n=1 Tax=Alcanivorax sp. S71-1-4 TaxID=1177159 RepID=UPI001358D267|nr:filamentous haemagglutinin family protein [Alcanivorax sp. S71-1-4]KAF0806097.1 Filamentous hemagglutinin family outer membrane protein [Alcanivorax sp. S71-1-4]